MKRTEIKQIFADPSEFAEKTITVAGWARTIRSSNVFGFIELNDGSYFKNLQVVIEEAKLSNYREVIKQNIGASFVISGTLVLTPEAKQPFELKAECVELEGASTPDYPLQKKKHSFEYLRTIAHLRPRTNTFNAVFRVRSCVAYAIHSFFFVILHNAMDDGLFYGTDKRWLIFCIIPFILSGLLVKFRESLSSKFLINVHHKQQGE